MFDRINLFLNCDQELQKKIKIFIEYFVRYYGEDKRKEIEEQLGKAVYIGYVTPENRKSLVRKLKEEESKLLQQLIIDKNTLSLDKNDIFDNNSYEYENIMPVAQLAKLKELYDKGKKQRLKEFNEEGYSYTKRFFKDMTKIKYLTLKSVDQLPMKLHEIIEGNISYYLDKSNAEKTFRNTYKKCLPLLKKINPNVTFDNLGEVFNDERVAHLLFMHQEASEQYKQFLKDNEHVIEPVEKSDEIKSRLKEKYYLMYLKENIDLIPESERTPIYEYLDGKTKNFFPNTYIRTVLGYSLDTSLDLEYFDEKCDQILEDKEPEWRVSNIQRNRMDYFKGIGLDLGSNYEAYVNDSECQRLWPSKEMLKRVYESKNKFNNKFNNEYFESLEEFKAVRERIDACDLLDKNDSFNAKLLTDSGTFISPNVRLTEKGYDTHSLFVINFKDLNSDTLDHHIVHELNHLYELALSKIDSKTYEMIVGWDIATGTLDEERNKEVDTINIKDPKRNYELFNEIINELIAQDISKMMHDDKVTVFDTPGNSRYQHTTGYEDYIELVYSFFHEYKDVIIESRKQGNVQVIYNEVGEDNFNEMNLLIQYFNEHFEGLKILNLRTALMKHQKNEMTDIYYEIIAKRDEILANMKQYKENHKSI